MSVVVQTSTRAPSLRLATRFDVARWLRQIMLVLVLFSGSGAGYYAQQSYTDYINSGYYTTDVDDDAANPLVAVGTLTSVLIVGMAMIARPRRWDLSVLSIMAYLGLVALTTLWSHVEIRTLIPVAKGWVYGIGLMILVQRQRYEDTVKAVVVVGLLICLVSLYLCFSNPIFRASIGADGWRGLFPHKNKLAMFCLFEIALLLPAAFILRRRLLIWATIALLSVCLILSQGKTAIAMSVFYAAFSVVTWRLSRHQRRLQPALQKMTVLILIVAAVGLAVVSWLVFEGLVTFTNRTTLWSWFLNDGRENLIFGAGGYTAPLDPSFEARALSAVRTPTPDSSYVLILYNQGIIGLLAFFSVMASIWGIATRTATLYSFFVVGTLIVYMCFAGLESDAQLNYSFATIAVMLQALLLQQGGYKPKLREQRSLQDGISNRTGRQFGARR